MKNHFPTTINRRYATLAVTLITLTWLYVAFRPNLRVPTTADWKPYISIPGSASAPFESAQTTATSIDIFAFPPVDSSSLKSVCDDTQWNASMVFTCDNNVGGVGNIRNSILNCVRYTISAGAALVIPQIIIRDTSDISRIRTGQRTSMDYMFDVAHFVQSLRLSCPQLHLYEKAEDIPNRPDQRHLIALMPESLIEKAPKTGLQHPEEWRSTFHTWVSQFESPYETRVVELARSYLQYPIYSDGEDFALSFGSILKFRADTRILATAVLRRLSQTFNLGLESQWQEPILRDAFFGAHLRTEKDAKEGWPAGDWKYSRYDMQSKLYLSQALDTQSSIIYVASGDPSEVSLFTRDAASINATVTTKSLLLTGTEKGQLEALTWDQQGLVDFLVMLKASNFAGVGHSSFAWNIALKRHASLKGNGQDHLKGPQLLSDEISQVYGLPRSYPEYASCLWP